LSKNSPKMIIQTAKSTVGKVVFRQEPELKQKLWDGEFWSDRYYVVMVRQKIEEML